MKKFKELNDLYNTFDIACQKTPELANTKLGYAFKIFFNKNCKQAFQDYNEELEMLRVDNAATDDKGCLISNPEDKVRGFKYEKSAFKILLIAEKKLLKEWNIKEFEVEPYFSREIPDYLSEIEKEEYAGLIIDPEMFK